MIITSLAIKWKNPIDDEYDMTVELSRKGGYYLYSSYDSDNERPSPDDISTKQDKVIYEDSKWLIKLQDKIDYYKRRVESSIEEPYEDKFDDEDEKGLRRTFADIDKIIKYQYVYSR